MDPKWQKMLVIVNANQCNPKYSYKKLIISRLISENIFILLLQFIGLMFSAYQPLPIWLASGTACAFVMLRGVNVLPGILLGSLIAFSCMHIGLRLTGWWSLLFTLQPYLIMSFCYRYLHPTLVFTRISDFIKYLGIVAFTSLLIAWYHLHFWYAFLANFNGLIFIATTICYWDMYFTEIYETKNMRLFLQSHRGCVVFFSFALVNIIACLFFYISLSGLVTITFFQVVSFIVFWISLTWGRWGRIDFSL